MKHFCIILLLFLSLFTYSQNPQWLNYTNGENINDILLEGDNVWVGTDGGLVEINLNSGSRSFFNRASHLIPDNRVRSITIDNMNQIWFISPAGVSIWNGDNLINYDTSSTIVQGNELYTIESPHGDDIYIGTNRGLVKFDGTSWLTYDTSNSGIPDNNVTAVNINQDGELWVGTLEGLARFDGLNWIVYNTGNSSITNNHVTSIAFDQNGSAWIGLQEDLIEISGEIWTVYTSMSTGMPLYLIKDVMVDYNNAIWVATRHNGVVKFDNVEWIVFDPWNSGIPTGWTTSLACDDDNLIYVGLGLSGEGLVTFDGLIWNNDFNTSNSGLLNFYNNISCLAIDNDNTCWMGQPNMGVSGYNDNSWTSYDFFEYVRCIDTDATGHILTGANDGLFDLYNDSINTILYTPGLYVEAICFEDDQTYWVSSSEWLFKHHNGEWENMDLYALINSISVDGEGNVWLTSYYSGLFKYDGIDFHQYNVSNSGISTNFLECVDIESDGTVWIGTTYHGIIEFDGANWTTFDINNSNLPDNRIHAIHVDIDDNIWIGTENGMAKFDHQTWTEFKTNNSGIPANIIHDIKSDGNGNIYIGTYRGGFGIYNQEGIVFSIYEDSVVVNKLSIYPNPTNERINISLEGISAKNNIESLSVKIYTSNGSFIKENMFSGIANEISISVQDMNPGLYLVNVLLNNKKYTGKFILY